ncbi:sodium/nucleoside cotransporter-like protein, partial [Sarcoptes scabiei]
KHRDAINWNQVLLGFTIQLIFGIGVLRTQIGKNVFQCIGEKINTFLSYTQSGTTMGMPVIIFFSFFVSILYHYGVMQIIVRKFGFILQSTIGTTACESISASGNIFLGMVSHLELLAPLANTFNLLPNVDSVKVLYW